MGQITIPTVEDVFLTDVDRLTARNAAAGLSPAASHVIILGQDAGTNSTRSDTIILGAFAADAGLNGSRHNGAVIIGVQAASALTSNSVSTPSGVAPPVVIGYRAAELMPQMDSSVIIGGGALKLYADSLSRCVVIGNEALGALDSNADMSDNVVIGYNAWKKSSNGAATGGNSNVFIGASVCGGNVQTVNNCVSIGADSCGNMGGGGVATSDNCVIGADAGSGIQGGNGNTLIGTNAEVLSTATQANQRFNVCLGSGTLAAGSQNVVLGTLATTGSTGVGLGNIILGYRAGESFAAGDSHLFVVETRGATGSGNTQRAILYGDLNTGNLVVGNSVLGTNRDTAGTNLLKLINGTLSGNPSGGGFLLANAGELQWRSSNGNDYLLTPYAVRTVGTVASLAALGNLAAGQRAYVTDALAPAFAAVVAGAGAVFTPVYYDGAAWRCG